MIGEKISPSDPPRSTTVRNTESSTECVGPSIWLRSLTFTTYVGLVRFAHWSGWGSPTSHSDTLTSTPYDLTRSLMTVPQDSMRTVLATNGEPSRNGLVRTTYMGVFSISRNVDT